MGINQYINETRAEMKHVSWPSRNQTLIYTALVIFISVAVSIYLGVWDAIFTQGIKWFIPSLN
jgi:preprotein translocase subunit SecE